MFDAMTGRGFKCVMLACCMGWVLPIESVSRAQGVHGAVTVFEVQACAGTRHGTGFLADDWPHTSGPVLITALHVVHGCQTIEFSLPRCGEALESGTKEQRSFRVQDGQRLVVWRELDLVAIPLRGNQVRPGWTATRPAEGAPALLLGEPLHVMGLGKYSVCPRSLAHFRYTAPVFAHVDNILKRTAYSTPEIKGTLGDDVQLIIVSGDQWQGFSGAPLLTVGDAPQLVGMHEGGAPNGEAKWSVALHRAVLQDHVPTVHSVGATIAKHVYAPDFAHADFDAMIYQWGDAPWSDMQWVALGGGVAGAAALAATAVLSILAARKDSESNQNCVGDMCGPAGRSAREEALRLGDAATATGIGGGVLLAGALVLFLLFDEDPTAALEKPKSTMSKGSLERNTLRWRVNF